MPTKDKKQKRAPKRPRKQVDSVFGLTVQPEPFVPTQVKMLKRGGRVIAVPVPVPSGGPAVDPLQHPHFADGLRRVYNTGREYEAELEKQAQGYYINVTGAGVADLGNHKPTPDYAYVNQRSVVKKTNEMKLLVPDSKGELQDVAGAHANRIANRLPVGHSAGFDAVTTERNPVRVEITRVPGQHARPELSLNELVAAYEEGVRRAELHL